PSEFGLSSRLRPSGFSGASPASTRVRQPAIVRLTATLRLSRTRGTNNLEPGTRNPELRTGNRNPNTNQERGMRNRERLPVYFLLDSVLFELLVQIAARRVDQFGRS